jgi:ankyrin repeat protein
LLSLARPVHLLPDRADTGRQEDAVEFELHHELRPRQLEQYRGEAKHLLRAVREGNDDATERAQRAIGERVGRRFVLADALHVVAVEHGYRSWPAFKHDVESRAGDTVRPVGRIGAAPSITYAEDADRLLADTGRQEPMAVERLRAHVPRLADRDATTIARDATMADARLCLAREYGFRTWPELVESADRAHNTHYSRLPDASAWKHAVAAIQSGNARELQRLLDAHPGLEHEDPGMTLLSAAAQPEAGSVPRAVVDVLIEVGSELDVPLNLAACFNKADLVGWLLDAGANPAATRIWGITPLQSATYHGSREAVDVLVSRAGLLPDALYIAAAADDLERIASWFGRDGQLLAATTRTRPNLSDVGWPPQPPPRDDPDDVLAEALSLAAQLGRTRACAALLDRGADVARGPLYGITPLHFAASMSRRDTVDLLVRHGAPLGARDRLHDGTPLDWARHNGCRDETVIRLVGG